MIKEEFYYDSTDNQTKIHAVMWIPEGNIKAILQISHGVTEYILRYEPLANFLTDRGIVVVGNDHLGHGKSIAKDSKPMYFGPAGSWDFVVDDIKSCYEKTKKKFPNIPYYMLGFSLGSFVVRTFLIKYPNLVDGAVIMGTGQTPEYQISMAKFMANKEAKKYGEENSTQQIRKLTFGTYNKIFAPNRTDYDWLCSNEKELDKYIEDKNRGGDFSSGLFREMLCGMSFVGKKENVNKMNKETSIIFLSGGKDPVGNQGRGVIKVYNSFKKSGIKNVNLKLYPKMRHDILHEDIKNEVYEDIYNFINNNIKK